MYCENFQDKSLSRGEFWSFTMVLEIVELSDNTDPIPSCQWWQKGQDYLTSEASSALTLVRPAVTLRKAQYTWQEKSRRGKKGRTANFSEHKVSVYLAAGPQYFLQELPIASPLWAWTFEMLIQLPSEWCQAQLCTLNPKMAGKEVSGWPWQASFPLFFPAAIFLLENLTLLWPVPQTQEPLNGPQIIQGKQCMGTNQ